MHKSIVLNRVHWYWLPLFMVLGYALYSLGTLSYAQSAQDDAVSDNVTANVPETDTPQLIEHIQPDQKKIETQVDPVLQDPTLSLQTPLDQSPQPANMSVEPKLSDPDLSLPPLQNHSDELSQPANMSVEPELSDPDLSLPPLQNPSDELSQPANMSVEPELSDPDLSLPPLQNPSDELSQPANMSVEPELSDPDLSLPPLQNPSDELSQPANMSVEPELSDPDLSLPPLSAPQDQSPQPEKTQAAPQTTPSDQLDQQLSVPPDLPVNTQSPKKELDTLMQKEIIKTGEQLQQNGKVKEEIKQESKALTQQHIVESAKNKMVNFLGQYGKVEMGININDQWKLGHYNFEYLYPFHDQFNKQLLMQMGAIEFQNRHILHMGAGFRVLDHGVVIGGNGFIDGDLTTKHLRYSLGLECGSDLFLLRSNIYVPISDEKNDVHLSGTPYDRTKPVYGVDLNATTVLWPKYSLLGELNYNQWFGKNINLSSSPYHSAASGDLYDDMYSVDAKMNWQPFSLLSTSLGLVMMKNQKKPILNTSLTLTWQFDRTFDEQLKPNNVRRSMKDNLLRYFFKREHSVFLSYLEKCSKSKKIDSVLIPDKKAAFEAEDVMIQPTITTQYPVVSHKWSGSGEPYLKPVVAGSFDAIFSRSNMTQNTEQYDLQLQVTDKNNKVVTSNNMTIYLFKNARLELYKDSAKINVVTNYKVAHNTVQSINVYWELYDPNGVATNDSFVRWQDPDSVFIDPSKKYPTIDSTQPIKSYKPQLVVLPAAGKEVSYDVSVDIIQKQATLKLYKDSAKKHDVHDYILDQYAKHDVNIYWELYDSNGVPANYTFVRWDDPENILIDPKQTNPTIDSKKQLAIFHPKLVVLPASGYEVSYDVSVEIKQVNIVNISVDKVQFVNTDLTVSVEAVISDFDNAVVTVKDATNTIVSDAKFAYKGNVAGVGIYEGKIKSVPWGKFSIFPVIHGLEHKTHTANLDTHKLYVIENPNVTTTSVKNIKPFIYDESAVADMATFPKLLKDPNAYYELFAGPSHSNAGQIQVGLGNIFFSGTQVMPSSIKMMIPPSSVKEYSVITYEATPPLSICSSITNTIGSPKGDITAFLSIFTDRTWLSDCDLKRKDTFKFSLHNNCNDLDRNLSFEMGNEKVASLEFIVKSKKPGIWDWEMRTNAQAFKLGLKCYKP